MKAMKRTNYNRGVEIEHKAVKEFRNVGYLAQRTAGSHSLWDVTVVGKYKVLLVQCKRMKAKSSGAHAQIRHQFNLDWELVELAPQVVPVLLIWVDHKGWIYPPSHYNGMDYGEITNE